LKKLIISTAVLSVCAGAAHAQSSTLLYGAVDGGLRYLNNATTKGGNLFTTSSNGFYRNNRLDFGGTEDLGNGLNAHFLLESGFNLSTGALDNTANLIFMRQAYVGLGSKTFGSVDAGRQWTIAHDINFYYDPFYLEYPAILPLSAAGDGTRVSNDIKYTGKFGGFTLEADDSLGGVAGDFSSASARAVGARYDSGTWSVGSSYGYRSILVGTSYTGDNFFQFGANYKIANLKLFTGYMDENQESFGTTKAIRTRNLWGGLSYDFSAFLKLQAGYYKTNVSNPNVGGYGKNMGMIGLAYNLSKATSLYAEVDYTHFRGNGITLINTTGEPHQVGATVGLHHDF
jgi:predicted porin